MMFDPAPPQDTITLPLAPLAASIEEAEQALAAAHNVPPSENPAIASQMIHLGDLYRQEGETKKAAFLYIEALNIIELYATDTPGYYRIAHEIATLYDELGDPGEAAKFYERAIAISEKSHGVDACEVATILNNLALCHKLSGKPEKAETNYHKALEIYERIRGSDHPDVAAMLNNLGALYTAQGEFEMAEAMHLRSLSNRQRAFGPNHPDVAQSLSNLAVVYHSQQNWKKAGNYYRDALDVLGKQARTDWEEYAIILHNYADFLRQTGKSKRADDLESELQTRLISVA